MVKVHELMVAGSSLCPIYTIDAGRKTNEAREHLAIGNQMYYLFRPVVWPVPHPRRLKRKFIL